MESASDCLITFEPAGCRVPCAAGTTILDAARAGGLALNSVCGGEGTCGQCLVRIVAGPVSDLTATERALLDQAQIAAGTRLACQARALGNVTIDVPLASRTVAQRLELTGLDVAVPFDPAVHEHLVTLNPPSIQNPRSDVSLLSSALAGPSGDAVERADLAVLQRLPGLLREHRWQVRVSRRGDEIVDVRPPDELPLGLAVDIGTTKVAVYLVDMETGQRLAVDGMTNPQVAYGEDVLSRIAYAMKNGSQRLTGALVEGVNKLVGRLCAEPERIVDAVVVGNTAMHHFFAGLPVRQLGLAPYNAVVSEPVDVKARDVGLRIGPGAYVHLFPNVAGFVGADHVAMIEATGLDRAAGTYLGLDIGTNTEVVLARHGKLLSCSTASGPALEGAHIKHGLRAVDGAIEQVRLMGDIVQVTTIGGAAPIGLCGSGVLDAVDQMRRHGFLDRRGRMQASARTREANGEREFVLVPAAESGTCTDISLSEHDVSEIMLAKAAIRTGIDALLEEAGVRAEELDGIVIAGAFGTHIDVEAAIGLGMLPALSAVKIRQVGNAAGTGAYLGLVSAGHRRRAVDIAQSIRYLELMRHPDFSSHFGRAMFLPGR